jgi:hypothetical protein
VVRGTTLLIGNNILEQRTSSSSAIYQALSQYGAVDDDIVDRLIILLTAVPKCLSGEAFRLYREEQKKRLEAEVANEAKRQAELDEWRREQEARLDDPTLSEEEKQFIRECLGIDKVGKETPLLIQLPLNDSLAAESDPPDGTD